MGPVFLRRLRGIPPGRPPGRPGGLGRLGPPRSPVGGGWQVSWIIWISLILLGLYFTIRDMFRPKSRQNPPILPTPPPLEAQINRLRNELGQHKGLQIPMIRELEARAKALEKRILELDAHIKVLEDRINQ